VHGVSGAESLVSRLGGQSPPEAESLLDFLRSKVGENFVSLEGFIDSFLPRDTMRKCSLCRRAMSVCPFVCISVRPSRFWTLSKQINISSKFFSPPGRDIILVFPYKTS